MSGPEGPAAASSGPVTARGLREALENLTVVVLWSALAWSHAGQFLRAPRASAILLVAFELLFAAFYLARREAKAVSWSPWDWTTAMLGSFLPLLLRPLPLAVDVWPGELLQAAGGLLALWGILSLRRSVGIVPANRGVRRDGAYRVVRHPLYGGYMLMQTGYLASNPTPRNAALLAVAFACQVARARNEERLLSRDPEYVAYQRRTPWRIVPFVW